MFFFIGKEDFDEVGVWLKSHSLEKFIPFCNSKNIVTLRDLTNKVQRQDIKKVIT